MLRLIITMTCIYLIWIDGDSTEKYPISCVISIYQALITQMFVQMLIVNWQVIPVASLLLFEIKHLSVFSGIVPVVFSLTLICRLNAFLRPFGLKCPHKYNLGTAPEPLYGWKTLQEVCVNKTLPKVEKAWLRIWPETCCQPSVPDSVLVLRHISVRTRQMLFTNRCSSCLLSLHCSCWTLLDHTEPNVSGLLDRSEEGRKTFTSSSGSITTMNSITRWV